MPERFLVCHDPQDVTGLRHVREAEATAGLDGPAFVMRLPSSFSRARTCRTSRRRRSRPRPRSRTGGHECGRYRTAALCPSLRFNDRTMPALGFGLQLEQIPDSQIISEAPSSPSRVLADTGTRSHVRRRTPRQGRPPRPGVLTRSGGVGLSILFRAMTIGTLGARAWSIASSVLRP